MPKVNGHLSDLFFNHENDKACDGNGGFDPDLLQEQADEFLDMVKGFCRSIGCPTGAVFPTAEDLTTDFLDRI